MAGDGTTEHLGDLHDPGHFARLVELDSSWREALDRLADLARRTLGVPMAQINVILSDQQVSLSSVAERPEWASWNGQRSVPLEASYCQHVIGSGEPLVVSSAPDHPLVKDNLATTEAGLRSYAGMPLKNGEGKPVATLCVADFSPREWETSDLDALAAVSDLLMREIQGRLSAQAALQQSEARFRSLIENGTDLVTALDPDGSISYQSPVYDEILGYDDDTLVGEDFTSLLHPDDVDRWEKTFFQPLKEGNEKPSAEWRMRHDDESWRTVRGTGVNLLDDPAVRGLVLNIHDVTREEELKRELQQAQKMEALGRLAGGVAHDFNNFITAIKVNAELLTSRDDLPEDAESDIGEIEETADRASQLTRQLLTFSRGQALELETLDLGDVVEEVVPLIRRLTGPGVELDISLEHHLLVEADKSQLGQVVMNLAVNAKDAMSSGGTLRVETREFAADEEHVLSHSQMEPGRYAMLVVADDGVGIPQDVQEHIFEPFFTTKGPDEGTGLGLSISWGIVKQMEGHIHLYSEPGRGTTFRLYFPRESADGAVESPRELRTADERPPETSGNILVVEDESAIRRVVTRVLNGAGHSVVAVETAEEALEIVEEVDSRIDLLVTDLILPGMNGNELARELARKWPTLTILFTSGYSHGELEGQRLDIGNAAFLPKPFGPTELSEAVADALALGSESDAA